MSEKTVPVSIYATDRTVVRAIAGAADELPATTVRRAIRALLAVDAPARSIAQLVAPGAHIDNAGGRK